MGLVVKALVVALLTLPVIAYVTGSMVGARSDLPAQREPVVIGDRMDVEPQQTIETEPARRPGQDDDDRGGRGDDGDSGDDADDADDADDDSVSVVRPQPRDIDDDADDRDDGPDDDSRDHRDHSGDDDD